MRGDGCYTECTVRKVPTMKDGALKGLLICDDGLFQGLQLPDSPIHIQGLPRSEVLFLPEDYLVYGLLCPRHVRTPFLSGREASGSHCP